MMFTFKAKEYVIKMCIRKCYVYLSLKITYMGLNNNKENKSEGEMWLGNVHGGTANTAMLISDTFQSGTYR